MLCQQITKFKLNLFIKLKDFTCAVNEFKCLNEDKCLPYAFVCDRTNHCADGSDEATCKVRLFFIII